MKHLFLLWTHDEHGPESLAATTSWDQVIPMAIKAGVVDYPDIERPYKPFSALRGFVEMGLDDLLTGPNADHDPNSTYGLFCVRLGSGWGGWHFQIVPLYEGEPS